MTGRCKLCVQIILCYFYYGKSNKKKLNKSMFKTTAGKSMKFLDLIGNFTVRDQSGRGDINVVTAPRALDFCNDDYRL